MLMELKNKYMIHSMEDNIKLFMIGLKKWAKINKIPQIQLCKVIGKDQTTVSNYFTGKTRPEPESINLWIDHYTLDHEEILAAGRKELEPQVTQLGPEDIKSIIAGEMNKYNKPINPQFKFIEFQDMDKACQICNSLIELEKLDSSAMRTVHKYIKFLISEKRGHSSLKEPGSSKSA